jgi:predicted RNA-binding Zn-ribbon protein involved in translation (DUF1610 family)
VSANKKIAVVITFLMLGVVLCLLAGLLNSNSEILRFMGVPFILLGLVLEAALFRCPACGRWLGRSFRPGKYCPYCGEIIE